MNRDENPIHFECNQCGYKGTSDELKDEGCPVCDSPDIEWAD